MQTKELKERDVEKLRSIIKEKMGVLLPKPIIRQVFTRSSFSKRYNNENFEFIGDTVISNYVVKKLCDQFENYSLNEDYYAYYSFNEDRLSRLKSFIVSNENLARIIDEWDVLKYLVVGKSDVNNNIDTQAKIKADLFEAIIGGITVYCNWNQEMIKNTLNNVLPIDDYILDYKKEEYRHEEFKLENAVTTLKQLQEKGKIEKLEYSFSNPDSLGYTENGDPIWSCKCEFVDEITGYSILVFANSKKDAKKCAAYLLLCRKYHVPNKFGPNYVLRPWWVYDKENNKLYPSK